MGKSSGCILLYLGEMIFKAFTVILMKWDFKYLNSFSVFLGGFFFSHVIFYWKAKEVFCKGGLCT